jgi:hypothetical protein
LPPVADKSPKEVYDRKPKRKKKKKRQHKPAKCKHVQPSGVTSAWTAKEREEKEREKKRKFKSNVTAINIAGEGACTNVTRTKD